MNDRDRDAAGSLEVALPAVDRPIEAGRRASQVGFLRIGAWQCIYLIRSPCPRFHDDRTPARETVPPGIVLNKASQGSFHPEPTTVTLLV